MNRGVRRTGGSFTKGFTEGGNISRCWVVLGGNRDQREPPTWTVWGLPCASGTPPSPPVEIPPPDTPVHVVALPSPARVAADYVTRTRGITGDIEVDILVFAIPHNHECTTVGLVHTYFGPFYSRLAVRCGKAPENRPTRGHTDGVATRNSRTRVGFPGSRLGMVGRRSSRTKVRFGH